MLVVLGVKALLAQSLELVDRFYLSGSLNLGLEPAGVRGLVFHTVLEDESERKSSEILPHQALTLQQYRSFFERLLDNKYQFIALDDLDLIDTHTGLFAYVTFDDGYFNNLRILPLLEELEIPIHIFVTTENVARNKKFWWDVVYSEEIKRGSSVARIATQITYFKTLDPKAIDEEISTRWGSGSWLPSGDLDRPLSPSELKDIAKHELVTIGNHTHRHAIATNLSSSQFEEELDLAQRYLEETLGISATSFAFPNGTWSSEYLRLCKDAGFSFGFGCEECLFSAGDADDELARFRVGRFSISASRSMSGQADMIRVTRSLDRIARRWWSTRKTNGKRRLKS
jgi:peptidoglycan/xylan/chitin deacetylase (PgdA/CDA1 family)